ncbi:hypothetical protein HanXRQr2_Chr07g0283831 [Helianthus annuus]|uniref:Uncharacterized protein n=1 Tax=Helianthus annuus TaxID=4232 RepID=A0A9K3NEZ3_HELAN|nr:hypothetical protein HanXRQr2_Chr07g0283831 [Helianthus annuus]KAJ0903839.1 hypothetical protein HanPSC8_Chr07g0274671 [Helianthus annuus]
MFSFCSSVIREMLGTSDDESKMRFKNKDFYLFQHFELINT